MSARILLSCKVHSCNFEVFLYTANSSALELLVKTFYVFLLARLYPGQLDILVMSVFDLESRDRWMLASAGCRRPRSCENILQTLGVIGVCQMFTTPIGLYFAIFVSSLIRPMVCRKSSSCASHTWQWYNRQRIQNTRGLLHEHWATWNVPSDPMERSKYQCNALLQLERSTRNKMATNRDNNVILSMIITLFAENRRNLELIWEQHLSTKCVPVTGNNSILEPNGRRRPY